MFGLLANCLAASQQGAARVLQWPHQGAQNLTKTYLSESKTTSLKFNPTTTWTAYPLGSGIGADFRKGLSYPLAILETKDAKASDVIYAPSNLYLSCFSLKKRTLGVELTSTPRYSASLSYSPWPSFLVERERMRPQGLVESYSLKASRAALQAVSSPRKRKRAWAFFWKMASMASLLNGMTSAVARRTKTEKRINFIDIQFIYVLLQQHILIV